MFATGRCISGVRTTVTPRCAMRETNKKQQSCSHLHLHGTTRSRPVRKKPIRLADAAHAFALRTPADKCGNSDL